MEIFQLPSFQKCLTNSFEALILPQSAFNISTKVPKLKNGICNQFFPIFNFAEYNTKSFRLVVDSKHMWGGK